MKPTHAGDVLAGRYHLTDLLSEARNGRFWRATDSILGRPVAIHVVAADDDRAPRLMDAARAAASVRDARLLRILDAETTDDIAYVVNEWGKGTSLDNVLAGTGPLPPRRAAWIAAEVAETLTNAHRSGHAHGRLNPENVLIDDLGAVRIIGFAVEAALHGMEPGQIRTDLVDLSALAYAGLTARWAGETSSAVPPAPTAHGRVLRPRQVRAGVPRVLDDLCDRVLGRHEEPLSAPQLHAVLMTYVGDASDLGGTPRVGVPVAAAPGDSTQVMEPDEDLDEDPLDEAEQPPQESTAGTAPDPYRRHRPDVTEQPATEAMAHPSADGPDEPPPTEPGLPPFELDSDWTTPREDPAPPPPPLEPPPPKPLFADEPRRPRPGASEVAPDPAVSDQQYWPWSGSGPSPDLAEEPGSGRVPGRNWLRLAIGVAVLAVLVVCVALAYNVSRGHDLLGGGGSQATDSPTASPSPSPTTPPAPIKGITAKDFDPYGDPPAEYPDLTHYAVDGDTATTWRTATYNDQFGPHAPALKPGVGLILDLKATYAVDSVHFDLVGSPTTVSVYVSDSAPTQAPSGSPAGHGQLGTSGEVSLSGHPQGRYVLVWFTSLPHASDGYRLEVAEAKVTGAKVH